VDEYFGSSPGSTSPLDPTWTAAPQLQAADALEVAQPTLAFAPAAPAAPPAQVAPPVAESVPVAIPVPPQPVAKSPELVEAGASVSIQDDAVSGDGTPLAVRVGAEDTSEDSNFLTDLLIDVLDRGCSDLHLTVGAPPTVRLNGQHTTV
jgi:twitching motility protein PilT